MEGLAARGHACRAVVRATSPTGPPSIAAFRQALEARGLWIRETNASAVVFEHQGVEVHAVTDSSKLRAYVCAQIREFQPTWSLVASEDPGQVLLEASLPRAVYFCQTTLLLPFGPGSFVAVPEKAGLIRRARGVIVVSRYLQEYLRRWGDIDSVVIPAPIYGSGPYPLHGRFDQGFVTMINPCAVKGISIFAALAARMRDTAFAAVVSWGATAEDRRTLQQLPNVKIMEPVDDIDEVFARTRILLVPSLWAEAFGCVAVEAMLRGIPVLASDVGGLPEAKLGVDYLLPVRPIERYERRFDDRMNPVAQVPPQDIAPWMAALTGLLTERSRYERLSAASRAAALDAVARTGIEPFESYLAALGPE
jgi:glycosyltransferase involved in cell wall biosynthesis